MASFLRSRRRRDYSRKAFSNPLFASPGREGRPRVRRRLWPAFVTISAIGGWIWLLFYAPFLQVSQVDVRGNDRVQAWEIEDAVEEILAERRWLIVPKRAILALSEAELAERLKERFVLASAEVVKDPPARLEVRVTERVSTALMQMSDGSQVLLDLGGTTIRAFRTQEALDVTVRHGPTLEERNGKRPTYHVIFDDKEEAFELGEPAVAPALVEAAIALPGLVTDVFGRNLFLAAVRVDGSKNQTVRAEVSEGWTIYLDIGQDLKTQLDNAAAVIRTKVGDRGRLDYVDVRFGEKIFFKMKE